MTEQNLSDKKIEGMVIGVLVGLNAKGAPLVAYCENDSDIAIPAMSTLRLCPEDIGKQVALMFERGDSNLPIVMGCIVDPVADKMNSRALASAEIDGDALLLSAEKEIILKCGESSITLTKAGKIILRGKYILSRSSGMNRIKGGSVQIN